MADTLSPANLIENLMAHKTIGAARREELDGWCTNIWRSPDLFDSEA
jgi:hypothetical protein